MASAVATEVYLFAVPLLVIFFLLVLPVPLLSGLMSKLITATRQLKVGPVPLLVALPVVMTLIFAQSFASYHDKYVTHAKTAFEKEIFALEYRHKRALHERNMYVHVLCAVLGFAILKIASLTLRVKELKAVAEKEKKKE